MRKIAVWGTGIAYDELRVEFQYYELIKDFEIVCVTSNDTYLSKLDAHPFITKKELLSVEFDYLMICAKNSYMNIYREALALGIEDEKILSAYAIRIPNFRIDLYMQLKNSKISVFANSCWGWALYDALKWEFTSPLIGIYIDSESFLKLMSDLKNNLSLPLTLDSEKGGDKCTFVGSSYLGDDIHILFPHEKNHEIIRDKWKRRIERINWENIMVSMFTTEPSVAGRFEELPYDNKVCFTSFETDLPHSFQIKLHRNKKTILDSEKEILNEYNILYYSVYDTLNKKYREYDIFELLTGNLKRI